MRVSPCYKKKTEVRGVIKSITVGETALGALGSGLRSLSGRTEGNAHPLRDYLEPMCHICHLALSSYDSYEVLHVAPPFC